MNSNTRVVEFVTKLIAECEAVLATKWSPHGNWVGGPPVYVDLEKFRTLQARCRLLSNLLGPAGKVWEEQLVTDHNNQIANATGTLGLLKGIKQSADEGLLTKYEELVFAEAFADLTEQAEYLESQGYFLAAGVILRAILEERVRRLCTSNKISIQKARPTLSDYNTELYKAAFYDKIVFKEVDALAAIGNDAAHNSPNLKKEDVFRLRDGVARFLQKFSC